MADPDSTQQPTASVARRIFIGQFGIRAGWGLVLFAAFLFCVNYGVSELVMSASAYVTHHSAQSKSEGASPADKDLSTEYRAQGLIRGEAVGFVSVAFATLILARIERRRTGAYGIGRARIKNVFPGFLTGVIALSALVAVLRLSHLLFFDARMLYGSDMFRYALAWLVGFFLVGLTEECLLRGYFLFTIERGVFGLSKKMSPRNASRTSFWIAAFLSSVVFAALHLGNPGETTVGILGVFSLGMLRCYALWRTGSLWWSIGMHAAWDWSQSFLWGVPDSGVLYVGRLFHTHSAGSPLFSGGDAGPEGSLFLLPTILLVAVAVRVTTNGQATVAQARDESALRLDDGILRI